MTLIKVTSYCNEKIVFRWYFSNEIEKNRIPKESPTQQN
jgi:hypothetical protein